MSGFYAGREIVAATEQDACLAAKADLREDWEGPSRRLGQLAFSEVIAAWPKQWFVWRPFISAGHTFYDDDKGAQNEALCMEARAVSAPRTIKAKLLDDLS